MEGALVIARLLLAATLSIAAIAKLFDRERLRKSVVDFGVTSKWAVPLAKLIPILELLAVTLLLIPQTISLGALATLLLLTTFTAAIVFNLVLGRRPDCSCFGQIGAARISYRTLFRNLLLALIAAVVVIESPSFLNRDQRVLAVGLVGTIAALGTLLRLIHEIALEQRELVRNFESIRELLTSESRAEGESRGAKEPSTDAIHAGTTAPSFVLESLDARRTDLHDLLSSRKDILIFFLAVDCAPCSILIPEINLWRSELGQWLSIAIITKGGVTANRAKFGSIDPAIPVLIDEDNAVSIKYGAKWTPGAVFVAANGTVASDLVFGVTQIRSMIDGRPRNGETAH